MALAEDGDGFLWVGSQNGLQRWDGYRFWTYKTKLGDANSLPDNIVNALYRDQKGRLWVGTNSGGLARYDRKLDRFIRYNSAPGQSVGAGVRAITGDGADGLWIIADKGLFHVDPEKNVFARVELLASDREQRTDLASAILRTPDGALWAGTEQGLEWSAPVNDAGPSGPVVNRSFERVKLPTPDGVAPEVTCLFRDRRGYIWVGTSHGVFVLDGSVASEGSRSARYVQLSGALGSLLPTQRILSISETTTGEIWLGTQDSGILAFNPVVGDSKWAARQIARDPASPDSLSENWVTALYLGNGGVMWAGTQRGVSYVDTVPKGAFTLFGGVGRDQPFSEKDVYSVLPRRDGSIWLGLKSDGINILDREGRKTGELRPQKGESLELPEHGLPQGTIPCMVENDDGSIYICAQQALYLSDPPDPHRAGVPRITRVPLGAEAATGLLSVLPDRDVLWVGGSNGLWKIDRNDHTGPAQHPVLSQPLTDSRVTIILRGEGDILWVGTENGLNRINLKNGEVERILPDSSDPSALGAGLVGSILMDRKGRLWVGTFSGGIDVLEGRDAKGRPRFHRIIDGLPNDNIDTLVQAPDGAIWASTDGGIARIDPETYAITTVLRRAEGALLPSYWNNAGAVTPAGELLFGGSGGLTVVRPALAKPWTYEPAVVVTHAEIGDTNVPPSRFNSGEEETPIWIAPESNNLTVEFSALDYTAPDRNRYEYKLEGFDKDWVVADPTRRVARYTNLPPGYYTLLLRGSNRDGAWAPVRRVKVHVIPAWYQTWWFTLLVILITLLILYGLFLLATAYLRRQQRELERQVARRTGELHLMTVELKESQLKLEHMAYSDSLTNLPNRRMFTEHFRQLLAMKMRQGGGFALLLIDFDRFKEINDTFGHDAGDAVLQELSRRMSSNVRASDCFARLGGDEFGLLLAEAPEAQGLDIVCHKILESFAEPVEFDGIKLRTTPSIGVALFPEDGETQDRLYKAADMALYQTKRQGGNGASGQKVELRPF
jgi:diguanylate cyclase (GGDEF)-like protein